MTDHDHPDHRVSITSTHPLAFPAGAVFPLLCPVREREWLEGWACRVAHAPSGLIEPGCVFTTEHLPEGPMTWVTTVHDPSTFRVEFVRVASGRLVVQLALRLEPAGSEACLLRCDAALTGIDREGLELVSWARREGGPYQTLAPRLARALEHFLATGRMLRRDGPQ